MRHNYDLEQAQLAIKMAVYLELALSYMPAAHRERAQELLDDLRASREAESAAVLGRT